MLNDPINIRPIAVSDLESIVRIYNQAIDEGQKTADTIPVSLVNRLDWYNQLQQTKLPALVAEIDDHVVGYAYSAPYRFGRPAVSKTIEISFYVDQNCHRKGIATKLLSRLMDDCMEASFHNLLAILIESNTASKALLEKFGFSEWGRLPKVVEFGIQKLDHLYYGKSLTGNL